MHTWDVDFQHAFSLAKHHITWGAGYRYVRDDVDSRTNGVVILPRKKSLPLSNVFLQDEIAIKKNMNLTLGTRLMHNVYTGFEWQPSARLSLIQQKSTFWTSVSRAVRTPSRYDKDFYLPREPQPPTVPSVFGGPDFTSEIVYAYELGYRYASLTNTVISFSTFYNYYKDFYSVEARPGTVTYQIMNGAKGQSWGAEMTASYQVNSSWYLKGGYTYFNKKLEAKTGRNFNPDYLGNDVRNQVMLQSLWDLPWHLHLDFVGRYLDNLPKTISTVAVPSYATFDLRLAYAGKILELALIGQNLAQKDHREFGPFNIPRNYQVKLSARF